MRVRPGLSLASRGEGDDLQLPRCRRRALEVGRGRHGVGDGQGAVLGLAGAQDGLTALQACQGSADGRGLTGGSSSDGLEGRRLARRHRPVAVGGVKSRPEGDGSDRRVESCRRRRNMRDTR